MSKRLLPYPEATPVPEHFRMECRLGFAPVLHCVCGASITIAQNLAHRPSRQMLRFRDAHSDCPPKE